MTRSAAIATLLVAALWAADARAQEPSPEPPSLQQEIARLNVTLKEIAGLLAKQLEGQETDLLIRRIELGSRSLEPRKERLRLAKASLTDLQGEEKNLVRTLEIMEEQRSKQLDAGGGESEPWETLQLQQMEDRVETVKRRQQELKREILELENDVAAREEDMRLLEQVIDSRLGLR